MSNHSIKGKVTESALDAVVIRKDGTVEDLGTVAYWNQSPWRRLVYRLKRLKDKTARM